MNPPPAEFEDMVVERCAAHQQTYEYGKYYHPALPIKTDYFVKFGSADHLWPEIRTQMYISDYATANPGPDVPRIPRVLHSFQRRHVVYLVMEYIQLRHPLEITDGAAAALVWLARVPPPPGLVLGPVGGGRIRHGFFKDREAPLAFSSVDALQRYMEKAYSRLPRKNPPRACPVTMLDDALMFSQGDVNTSNFGVDDEGRTVLLDFAEIALLPATLVAFTLGGPEFAPVLAALGLGLGLSHESGYAMASIRYILHMMGNGTLGLDEDGNERPRRKTKAN